MRIEEAILIASLVFLLTLVMTFLLRVPRGLVIAILMSILTPLILHIILRRGKRRADVIPP